MNFADMNRAAMNGRVNPPGATNGSGGDPFIRGTIISPTEEILYWLTTMSPKTGGMTCDQWRMLTWPQKLENATITVVRNVLGGPPIATPFALRSSVDQTEAIRRAHAIDAYCLGIGISDVGYRQASNTAFTGPYGKASQTFIASGAAGSGDVAAGFSFAIPELIVGGVIGAVLMKWLG